MDYKQKLANRIKKMNSRLCLGLDPDIEKIEKKNVTKFLMKLIETTQDSVAAYKPNIAYFEAMGKKGYKILYKIVNEIPKEIPIILDAKRSDIADTQKQYARAYFEKLKVDALTINPYLGYDSIEPFIYENKCVYILGITSNPGAADFQMKKADGKYLYELAFDFAQRLSKEKKFNAGLVIGLTNIETKIAKKIPDVPLLVPGLGAQGGNIDNLKNTAKKFKSPIVINVSRGILYDNPEKSFKEKSEFYKEKINEIFK